LARVNASLLPVSLLGKKESLFSLPVSLLVKKEGLSSSPRFTVGLEEKVSPGVIPCFMPGRGPPMGVILPVYAQKRASHGCYSPVLDQKEGLPWWVFLPFYTRKRASHGGYFSPFMPGRGPHMESLSLFYTRKRASHGFF